MRKRGFRTQKLVHLIFKALSCIHKFFTFSQSGWTDKLLIKSPRKKIPSKFCCTKFDIEILFLIHLTANQIPEVSISIWVHLSIFENGFDRPFYPSKNFSGCLALKYMLHIICILWSNNLSELGGFQRCKMTSWVATLKPWG